MDRRSVKKRARREQWQIWPPIYAPQVHITYWLKLVQTRFAESFDATLKGYNLIASEWAALRELYPPAETGGSGYSRLRGEVAFARGR